MTYLILCWEFLKMGVFAIGGGYATLPFLANISAEFGWFTQEQLTNFIAISEVTPGPIGINIATFAGYITGGVWGGVLASVALVLPAFVLILCLCRFFPNFNENKWVKRIFYGIIPVAIGLITATGFQIFKLALCSYDTISLRIMAWVLFLILLVISNPKFPKNISPFLLLFIGAVWGFLFL